MSDTSFCEFCGAPLPPRRRKYCLRRHAVHAKVLRYRAGLGEEYLKLDAARKRLDRRRRALRSNLGSTARSSGQRHHDLREASGECLPTIKCDFCRDDLAPACSSRTEALVEEFSHRAGLGGARFRLECATFRVTYSGEFYGRQLRERHLKQIELVCLEQHAYSLLAQNLLSQVDFHYRQSEEACDGHFGEATKLAGYLNALVEGPLRRAERTEVLHIKHHYWLLHLRLAFFRGDVEAVRSAYDALRGIADLSGMFDWSTHLEGVGVYTMLRNFSEAEKCLAKLVRDCPPALLNETRRAHARAVLYRLGHRERGKACAINERELRSLWDRCKVQSGVRTWRAVVPSFSRAEGSRSENRLTLSTSLVV